MRFFQHISQEFKTWNRNIRLFFVANLFYQFGFGMFSVLYNLYIKSLGFGQQMNGSIVSIQSLATALIFIPIGFMGDKTSRKKILIIGAFFSGIGLVGRSYVESSFYLQAFAFLSGLFAAFFQVTAVPFLAENADKKNRLQLFSYYFSMQLAVQVMGSMSGGYLADLMHNSGWSETSSLKLVLIAGGIASMAAFLPLLFVSERRKEQGQQPSAPRSEKAVRSDEPLPDTASASRSGKSEWRIIGQFTFAQLLIGFGSGLVVPYLNLYFTDRFSVSLTAVGFLISLGQVMTIVSMLIGPSLVRRVGQVRAIVLFQLLSLPFLLLTGFTNLLIVASLSFLFRQALMNAANPIQSAIQVDQISDSRRGIANSLTQTAFMLGWASMGKVQPLLISAYGTYWGYAATFSITGALYVSSSALFFFMFREPRRKAVPQAIGSAV